MRKNICYTNIINSIVSKQEISQEMKSEMTFQELSTKQNTLFSGMYKDITKIVVWAT